MGEPMVHRWQIGDVEVVRIVDDDFALPSEQPVPEWCVGDLCPGESEVGIAFSALALTAGDVRVVVDPWLANDGPRADQNQAQGRATALLGCLADAGIDPSMVDVVVNTHLDGIGWNTCPDGQGGWRLSFPNARYRYPAAEVEAIERGESIDGADGFAQLAQLTDIERVTAPLTLAPGVELVDAPGHNYGHLAVRIDSSGRLAIYPGHLVLTPFDIADPDGSADVGLDGVPAAAGRRAILSELAERGGLLLTTLLGGSGGGVVGRDGDGFRLGAPG